MSELTPLLKAAISFACIGGLHNPRLQLTALCAAAEPLSR
jgi:hypothetical protein